MNEWEKKGMSSRKVCENFIYHHKNVVNGGWWRVV